MQSVLVDAGPLIYLAKLDALDTFANAGRTPLVTAEIERETARPGLAYDHPDVVVIAEALRRGVLQRVDLTDGEGELADRIQSAARGIDSGEAQVLAAAQIRRIPALLFERRAIRLARSLGIETWSPVRLLFEGTPDSAVLRERIVRLAQLVDMRFDDLERLLELIKEGKK